MSFHVKAPDATWHVGTKQFIKTAPTTWTPVTKQFMKVNRTAARTITTKQISGNVATLTTSVAHGFTTGDLVTVSGVDATFNGSFIITGTPLTTTFTYAKTAGNTGPTASGGSAITEYWQEIWPLVPGPPSNLASTQPYQNDRIELTFSWTAPVTGAPTEDYEVDVYFNGVLYNAYNITAPTTAMSLTNNGAGFQAYAGQTMTFVVTPFAGGRAGTAVQSANYVVPQLPAPAAPTGLACTLYLGDLTSTWSHTSGNTLTNFTLEVSYNGAAYSSTTVAKGTSMSVAFDTWTGSAVNGGDFTARVKANGPGGSSAYVTFSGSIPSDPTGTSTKFSAGFLQATWTRGANCTAMTVYRQTGTSADVFVVSGRTTNGAYNIPGTDTWARDNTTQYRVKLIPYNSLGSGRVTTLGYCRKMSNPYIIQATDSNTYRGSTWRSEGVEYQGYTTSGMNYCYIFYGNQFRDKLNTTLCGYAINVTKAEIWVARNAAGGWNADRSPRLWLHTVGAQSEGANNTWAGGLDLTGLAWGDAAWEVFTASWVEQLIAQSSGRVGLGFYNPDTSASPSDAYMQLLVANTVYAFNFQFAVRITHDG